MPRMGGNALRRSSAIAEQTVFRNLPASYPTEDWFAYYWTVDPESKLVSARATLQLPEGYDKACREVEIGEQGCIDRIRRWGVACRMALLEEINFDATPLLVQEGWDTSDDQRALHWLMQATHFDLPGDFIIASDEHPFLLFAPNGMLAGSYTHWHTYLGALAYYVSDGRVTGTFRRLWWEDRALYQQAVGYLLTALGGKNDAQTLDDCLARWL